MIKRILILLVCAFIAASCSNKKKELLDVIKFNESKGITSLDPAFANSLPTIWPIQQLFNGLVQFDDSLNILPAIAHSWEIGDDKRTYTFHLRRDVFFHDDPAFANGKGRAVIASDFVYSFKRIIDDKVASPGRWVFNGIDSTFHDNGFFAKDDSTFIVKVSTPTPFFLGMLAMPIASVVPHEAIDKYKTDFRKHPVGTGPFCFKIWRENEMLVLTKNPNYFETDKNGRRLPYLSAINISFITDKYSEFMEFMRGNLDFISGINQSTKDELITNAGKLNPKYADRIQMLQTPYLNSEYIGITLNMPNSHPLANKLVRKAIAVGFDREKMLKHLRKSVPTPANSGIIPATIPGYKPIGETFKYNPTLAAELLRKAGFPNGKGIPTITITSTEDYIDLLEFIQHDLTLIGINSEIEIVPGPPFRQQMASGKLSTFRGSWIADYPDPENYMALFYSPNESPNGPNYTRFKNPSFDKLYLQSFEATGEERTKIFQAMDKIIADEVPVIPLYFDAAVRFAKKNIKNFEPNSMNYLYLKKVYKVASN